MSVTISKKITVRADSRLYANVSLTATESSTDIANNTSVISWSCTAAQVSASTIKFVGTNRTAGATVDVYINGTHCMSKYIGLTNTPSSWTESNTLTISHNSDGSKSVTVSLQITAGTGNYSNDPWTYGAASGSSTLTLTTLPRVSGISCGTLTMGTAGTIKIDRKASSFTDTITYKFGSTSGTICTKTSSTSVSFNPPVSLANQVPKATSGKLTITVTTYSGSTSIGSKSISVTLNVPSSVVPTIGSLTATIVNGDVPSSWGIYVQSKSKTTLKINNAAGAYGSTITGYSISGGGFSGSSSSLTTGFLNTTGSITFTAKVTDSRGRTSAAKTVTISVVAYAAPAISKYSLERCLASGTLSDEGTCVLGNVTFTYASCSSKNTVTTSVQYRKVGETSWTDANTTFTSGTNFVFGSAGISAESTYEVQLNVKDAFGTVTVVGTVSTASVLMDFKAGGKGIAIGKVAETDKAFEVNSSWSAHFYGKELKQLIWQEVYPVGSIYLSVASTNPGSLFGGTWVQISQGRFLLGQSSSYKVKATGGEATHTLSESEMPKHTHTAAIRLTAKEADGYGLDMSAGFKNRVIVSSPSNDYTTGSVGGSSAHNNMPPYFVCYMWQRTA